MKLIERKYIKLKGIEYELIEGVRGCAECVGLNKTSLCDDLGKHCGTGNFVFRQEGKK